MISGEIEVFFYQLFGCPKPTFARIEKAHRWGGNFIHSMLITTLFLV